MNESELRELDAWTAEHVMGWKHVTKLADFKTDTFIGSHNGIIVGSKDHNRATNWRPTSDSGNAMDVLKKCAENKMVGISIDSLGGQIEVWSIVYPEFRAQSETLELAIAQFAKALFSQTTK